MPLTAGAGLLLMLRRSKGDQEDQRAIGGVPLRQPAGNLSGAGLESVARRIRHH